MTRKPILLIGALLGLLMTVAVACGEDDKTATPTVAPSPTATPSASATVAPTDTPSATETVAPTDTPSATETVAPTDTPSATETVVDERAALIAQFPAEAAEFLDPLWSTELIALLLEVRNEGPDTLVWSDAGGEFNEGMQRAFNREWETITGWTITYVAPGATGNQILEEQVKAGAPEWDVSEIGSYGTADRMAGEGFLEKLDLSYFPVEFYPASTLVSDDWVSVIDYGTTLIWNTETFPDPATAPSKISDLFDLEKFPDQIRCLYTDAQFGWTLEYALLADGATIDEVYPLLETQEGVDRALALIDPIKDLIVYWESGAESVQFILDGQCDFGTTWNGRPALRIRDEPDLPLGMTWDGAFLDGDPFVIPRGAKNPKAALSSLAYALAPNNQCDLENTLAYGIIMSTEPYPDCLTDFAKVWGPQTDVTLPAPPDPKFWFANDKRIGEIWAEWKTK